MGISLSFLPKENRFFFLLHQSAMNIREVAGRLQDLMENFENVPAKVQEIKDLEEFGDQIIHDITHSLHRTFVTPIDREDILALAGRLDDVVDAIDEAAQYTLEVQDRGDPPCMRESSRLLSSSAATSWSVPYHCSRPGAQS